MLAKGCNKVADRFNTLVELMRIHLIRGETILNDENGKVFLMSGKVLYDLPAKLQMAGREGDNVSTTYSTAKSESMCLLNHMYRSYPRTTQAYLGPTDSRSRTPLPHWKARPHEARNPFALRKSDMLLQLMTPETKILCSMFSFSRRGSDSKVSITVAGGELSLQTAFEP